jgi:hypothetical protein
MKMILFTNLLCAGALALHAAETKLECSPKVDP